MSDHLPMTVALATDSSLIGDGLIAQLTGVPDVEVVGRVDDLEQLVHLVDELVPRAVIITIRSQVIDSLTIVETVHGIRTAHPDMGVVVISDRANDFALALLRGGSSGIAFLLDEKLPGIEAVVGALRGLQLGESVLDPSVVDFLIRRGDCWGIEDLSPRELDVLEQMAHGLTNNAIAEEVHLSVKSIEKCVTSIFLKLGPFQRSSDRRVSAALVFLRAQTDPFGPIQQPDRVNPVVVLADVDDMLGDGQQKPDDD